MPYKNVFLYQGQRLGSAVSKEDDPFRALKEGREKSAQIARILSAQVKGVKPSEIEVQCWWWDPQFTFYPELFPKEQEEVGYKPGRPTLRDLKVG